MAPDDTRETPATAEVDPAPVGRSREPAPPRKPPPGPENLVAEDGYPRGDGSITPETWARAIEAQNAPALPGIQRDKIVEAGSLGGEDRD